MARSWCGAGELILGEIGRAPHKAPNRTRRSAPERSSEPVRTRRLQRGLGSTGFAPPASRPPGVVAAASEEQNSSDHSETTPERSSGPVGGYATRETENPVDQQHPAEQELKQSPGLRQVDVHGFSAVVWVGCGLTPLRISCGRNARPSEFYGPRIATGRAAPGAEPASASRSLLPENRTPPPRIGAQSEHASSRFRRGHRSLREKTGTCSLPCICSVNSCRSGAGHETPGCAYPGARRECRGSARDGRPFRRRR